MHIPARLALHTLAPSTPSRRRNPRYVADVPTLINNQGYLGISTLLTDVSTDGFCLESAIAIPPESLIRLTLPGLGMVIGRVNWCRKGRIGGSFVNPLSQQRLFLIPGVRTN
jgi:PilZ domain